MKVTDKIRSKWNDQREYGDSRKLAKKLGLTESYVWRILSGDRESVPSKHVSVINEYFNKKTKLIQNLEA